MSNLTFTFDRNSDYKGAFKDAVTRIVRQNTEDMAQKLTDVRDVTDAYLAATSERPDIRELDELSSWIIHGTKGVSLRKKMEIKAMETKEAWFIG